MVISSEELRKYMIFHPLAAEQYTAMKQSGSRFVHYSSAEAAYHIITSKRIRLRNAAVMNDFMEVEHGSACLAAARHSPSGERLKVLIDGMFPDISTELAKLFDGWAPHFKTDTYIACLSEHNGAEDNLGRLSMWRAYGGSSGVAAVLNPDVFLSTSNAINTFTSPVAYLSEEGFIAEFDRVVDNIEMNRAWLIQKGKNDLLNSLFQAFRFAVLCTKHPGFKEEREWRIVYAPSYARSDKIVQSVELIRGAPQIVHSIPLKDYPEEDFVGAELPKLINRIIIGPTEFPEQLRLATVALLEAERVPDSAKKVVCSTIPQRQ